MSGILLEKQFPGSITALVIDPELIRLLGAYELKLMPHLFPPIEGDNAFWQGLLDEFTMLAMLAASVE